MNCVIQREKRNRSDFHKKFDEKSSLTLEKHRLSLAVVSETRVAIIDSSKKHDLQNILQSYNVVNKISSDIIHYKSEDYKLTREALHHQSKELILMRKSISIKATAASRLEE